MSGKSLKILIAVFVLFFSYNVEAISPAQPILPSDNIQDPGALSTPWGGCTPSDANCYVTTSNSSSFSENVDGLEYATSTGLSLTSGYVIPTSGSVDAWNTLVADSSNFARQGGNAFGATLTLGTNDANNLSFVTDGTERLTVTANGFVGINNSNPNYTLDINGDVNVAGALYGQDGNWSIDNSGFFNGSASYANYAQDADNASYAAYAGAISGNANSDFAGYNITNVGSLSATSLALTNGLSVASGGTGASSFTAGRILFGNGTSAINSTSTLFWDNTNGRLGVGTTTPTAKLSVKGSGTTTGLLAQFTDSANVLKFTMLDNGNTVFGTNVGAGTTSPLNISFGGTYGTNTPGSQANLKWDMYNAGGSNRYGIGMSAALMEFQAGSNNDGNFAWFTGNSTERMRLTTAGNLGIGTSTPGQALTVAGNISVVGNTVDNGSSSFGNSISLTNTIAGGSANLSLVNNSGNSANFSLYGSTYGLAAFQNNAVFNVSKSLLFQSNGGVGSGGTDSIKFTTGGYNNSPTMTITGGNTGNVGIGTSTPGSKLDVWGNLNVGTSSASVFFANTATGNVGIGTSAPAAPLHLVSASTAVDIFRLQNTAAAGYSSIGFFDNNGTQKGSFGYGNGSAGSYAGVTFLQANSGVPLAFGAGAAERMRIDSNGNIGIGSTTPSSKLTVAGAAVVGSDAANYLYFSGSATSPSLSVVGSSANADLLIQPKGAGQVVIGGGGWTYNTQSTGAGSILFNNGTNDTPNMKFAYGNNFNFGIDSAGGSTIGNLSGQMLRFIKQSDESGGAVIGGFDTGGNFSALGNIAAVGTGNSYIGGSLGIGTTSPTAALDVWSSNQFLYGNYNVTNAQTSVASYPVLVIQNRSTTNNTGTGIRFSDGNGNTVGQIGTVHTDNAGNGRTYIGKGSSEYLVVTSAGNVGIGTTTPGTALEIVGNSGGGLFRARNTNASGYGGFELFNNSNTQIGSFGIGNPSASLFANQMYLGTSGAYPLSLMTNNSAALTVLSGGNVGIGTTTPGEKLSLVAGGASTQNLATFLQPAMGSGAVNALMVGQSLSTNNAIGLDFKYVGNGSASNAGFFSMYGTNNLAVYGNGGAAIGGTYAGTNVSPANGLIVQGNVGVGTSTPTEMLSVAGNINLTGALKLNGNAGTSGMVLQTTGTGLQWVATSSLGISADITNLAVINGGRSNTVTGTNGVAFGLSNYNPALTGVAFGVSNTIATGSVYSTLVGTGNTAGGIGYNTVIGRSNTANSYQSTTVGIGNSAPTDYSVAVGINNLIYGAGSSHIAFGDTNTINPGGASHAISIGYNNTVNVGGASVFGSNITNNTTNSVMIGSGDGAKLTILSNGNLGVATTTPGQKLTVAGNAQFTGVGSGSYGFDLNLTADGVLTTSASDERLKQNIMAINSSSTLEKMNHLKPSTFDWKSDGSHDLGLIAQEVQSIFPELVFTNPSDGYLGINYSRFTPLLISAIQELSHKVDAMFAWFKDGKFNIQSDVCVDDVCVTKDQFKNMLRNAGAQQASVVPVVVTPPVTPPEDNSTSTDEVVTPPAPEENPVVVEPTPEPPPVEPVVETPAPASE